DSPYESSPVTVTIAGQASQSVVARKHKQVTLIVSLPAVAEVDVRIHCDQSFAPATVLRNQDPRLLAVQLTGVEQR
ncbi:MAG: hypothetical protein ABIP63_05195, partial [Thermoanaerobaculia bacterium]